MAIKVGLVSLGCSKNLVDSERMLFKLRSHGYELVTEPGLSDVAIVNTCGFITAAKEEAIETILELGKLKEEGTIKKIIITGCLSERYQKDMAEQFPEVDAVIGIGNEADIVDVIDRVMQDEKIVCFENKKKLEITGDRIISTLPFFAYLKVAEGCDNCCSYCAIPKIRGRYRSAPMEDVLKEAKWLCENGVTELIVIAQDTTRYGEDLYGRSALPELLGKLCETEGLRWLRVLYCYPERITDELIDVIAKQDKIVKYMDIPIQHCNGEILRRMNRQGNRETLTELMKKLRERIPGITIRTTLITGFPGETKEQFEELAEFVKETEFDRLGCFAYSREEGTAAANFEDQVEENEKQHRADIIMESQQIISRRKNEERIGTSCEAVVEGFDKFGECYFGRSAADAPDIDGKLFFTSERQLSVGEYVTVEISDTLDYDLIAEVKEQ